MKLKRHFYGLIALLLLTAPSAAMAGFSLKPEVVRALYIIKLISSTTWPDDINKSPELNVCIVGDKDETDSESFDLANKKREASEEGKHLKLVYVSGKNIKALSGGCNVVYISQSEEAEASQILSALENKPVLTISSIKHFVSRGGMLGLVPYNEAIRFAVNKTNISNAGLKIKADALALAVEDPE